MFYSLACCCFLLTTAANWTFDPSLQHPAAKLSGTGSDTFIPYSVPRYLVINGKRFLSVPFDFFCSLVLPLNTDFYVLTNATYPGVLLRGLVLPPAQSAGILIINISDGQVSLGSSRLVIPVTEIKGAAIMPTPLKVNVNLNRRLFLLSVPPSSLLKYDYILPFADLSTRYHPSISFYVPLNKIY